MRPMPAPKLETIKHALSKFMGLCVVIIMVGYVIPNAKHALFPDQMTRIERMLRHSTMEGYRLSVDRQTDTRIILTAYDGSRSITTELFRDAMEELESEDTQRILMAHSVNSNAEGLSYLTWTRMTADADLKRLERLEMKVCGQMKNQDGRVPFKDRIPVIECAVPVEAITCVGRK